MLFCVIGFYLYIRLEFKKNCIGTCTLNVTMNLMYFLNRHYFIVIFVEMLESIVKQEVLCILDFVLSGEVPSLSPSIYSI